MHARKVTRKFICLKIKPIQLRNRVNRWDRKDETSKIQMRACRCMKISRMWRTLGCRWRWDHRCWRSLCLGPWCRQLIWMFVLSTWKPHFANSPEDPRSWIALLGKTSILVRITIGPWTWDFGDTSLLKPLKEITNHLQEHQNEKRLVPVDHHERDETDIENLEKLYPKDHKQSGSLYLRQQRTEISCHKA
jgi:hypothetical protein